MAAKKKPVSAKGAAALANFLKNKGAASAPTPAKKPAAAAPMVADTDADEE